MCGEERKLKFSNALLKFKSKNTEIKIEFQGELRNYTTTTTTILLFYFVILFEEKKNFHSNKKKFFSYIYQEYYI